MHLIVNQSSSLVLRSILSRPQCNKFSYIFRITDRFYCTNNSNAKTSKRSTSSFTSEIPDSSAGVNGEKTSEYFTNRSLFVRLRHKYLRARHTFISSYAWLYSYLWWSTMIAVPFVCYHIKYRFMHGWDAPITNVDWYKRRKEGTLDPELIRRQEQYHRYFKKRFSEGIND